MWTDQLGCKPLLLQPTGTDIHKHSVKLSGHSHNGASGQQRAVRLLVRWAYWDAQRQHEVRHRLSAFTLPPRQSLTVGLPSRQSLTVSGVLQTFHHWVLLILWKRYSAQISINNLISDTVYQHQVQHVSRFATCAFPLFSLSHSQLRLITKRLFCTCKKIGSFWWGICPG